MAKKKQLSPVEIWAKFKNKDNSNREYLAALRDAIRSPEFIEYMNTGKLPKGANRDTKVWFETLANEKDNFTELGDLYKQYGTAADTERSPIFKRIMNHPDFSVQGAYEDDEDADIANGKKAFTSAYKNSMIESGADDVDGSNPTNKPGDLREVLKSYSARGNISPEAYNLLIKQLKGAYGDDWQNAMTPDERGLFSKIKVGNPAPASTAPANTNNTELPVRETVPGTEVESKPRVAPIFGQKKDELNQLANSPEVPYEITGPEQGNNAHGYISTPSLIQDTIAAKRYRNKTINDNPTVQGAKGVQKWINNAKEKSKELGVAKDNLSEQAQNYVENTEDQMIKDQKEAVKKGVSEGAKNVLANSFIMNPTFEDEATNQLFQSLGQKKIDLMDYYDNELRPELESFTDKDQANFQNALNGNKEWEFTKSKLLGYVSEENKNSKDYIDALKPVINELGDEELAQGLQAVETISDSLTDIIGEERQGGLTPEEAQQAAELYKQADEIINNEIKNDPTIRAASQNLRDQINKLLYYTFDNVKTMFFMGLAAEAGAPQWIPSAMDKRNAEIAKSETNFAVKQQDAYTENMFRDLTEDNIADYLNKTEIQPLLEKLRGQYGIEKEEVPSMVVKGLKKAYEEYKAQTGNSDDAGFAAWYLQHSTTSGDAMSLLLRALLQNTGNFQDLLNGKSGKSGNVSYGTDANGEKLGALFQRAGDNARQAGANNIANDASSTSFVSSIV